MMGNSKPNFLNAYCRSSSLLPGAWPANWLQGKATISKPCKDRDSACRFLLWHVQAYKDALLGTELSSQLSRQGILWDYGGVRQQG